jgi:hypothetical protein
MELTFGVRVGVKASSFNLYMARVGEQQGEKSSMRGMVVREKLQCKKSSAQLHHKRSITKATTQ